MTVEHLIVGLLGAILASVVAFGLRLDVKIDRANDRTDKTNDRIDAAVKDLKEDARVAHAEIGANIRETGARLDAAVKDLKEDARVAHAEIGANIRETGARLDAAVAAIRARLVESGAAPASANLRLSAVRGVLRAAWRLGLIDTDSWQRAADVGAVRGERLPAGRALELPELAALFENCADGKPGGARDACLLALLFGAGLRRAEASAVQVADVVDEGAEGLAVKVVGKGNRQRAVYVTNGGAAAVRAWLDVRGSEPGPLLCRVTQAGTISPAEGLTPAAVRLRVTHRCRKAGVQPASPHDLRRTFVSQMLDASGDVSSVQRLAGHASVSTTVRYDRRGERAARRAASLLHVPYQGAGGAAAGAGEGA